MPLHIQSRPPLAATPFWSHVRTPHVTCVVLLAVFVLLASVDAPVAWWVHTRSFPAAFKSALRLARLPGHYGFTLVLAAAVCLPDRSRWRAASAVLAAGALASGATAVLKWCFGRHRPLRGGSPFEWRPFPCLPWDGLATRNLSFPSGDATLAFATAAVVAVILPKYRRLAFGWAVLVALTRVLQGAHYPTDVAAGALVGVGFAKLVLWLPDAVARPGVSRRRERPATHRDAGRAG